jgi:hypothetical protein
MEDAQEDAGAGELDVARDTATSAALVWEETGADAERQSSEVEVVAAQVGIDGEPSPLLEEQPPEAAPEPGGEQPTTADAIRVSVTVNDKRLDVTEDLNAGTVRFDPHGATLTYQDVAALMGAQTSVEARLAPAIREGEEEAGEIEAQDAPQPRLTPQNLLEPQDDLLLRVLTHLSEAPVDRPLEVLQTAQPDPEDITVERPGEEGRPPPADATADPYSDGGLETASGQMLLVSTSGAAGKDPKKCEEATRTLDFKLAASACTWNDDEFYIHTCATTQRWHQHDAFSHCMFTARTESGPWSYSCTGRCGVGCGPSGNNGYGIYSLDCLDHDRAVGAHGYASPSVQDEFAWTDDDSYYGWRFWTCSR